MKALFLALTVVLSSSAFGAINAPSENQYGKSGGEICLKDRGNSKETYLWMQLQLHPCEYEEA